jgi:hypothetical protein
VGPQAQPVVETQNLASLRRHPPAQGIERGGVFFGVRVTNLNLVIDAHLQELGGTRQVAEGFIDHARVPGPPG